MIHPCDGRTDGQTDGRAIAYMLSRVKMWVCLYDIASSIINVRLVIGTHLR